MYIVRCRETERLYICYRLQFHKPCDKPRLLATRKETPQNFIHFCIPVLHPKTKSSKRFHEILLCRTMHACTPCSTQCNNGVQQLPNQISAKWLVSPQGVQVVMLVPLAELDHASIRLVRKSHIEGLGVRAEC